MNDKENNDYLKHIESLKKEGYTVINVPAYSYKTCRGCKYYEYSMIRSGFDPKYTHNCKYPDINTKINYSGFYGGNLSSDKTPDWCPYIKKENNNNNNIRIDD